jgi:hypothetical protein
MPKVRKSVRMPRKEAIVEAAALIAELRRHLAVAEQHLDDLLAGRGAGAREAPQETVDGPAVRPAGMSTQRRG